MLLQEETMAADRTQDDIEANGLRLCPLPFSDHTYATKDGHELKLRLWPSSTPTSPSSSSSSPWILWTHGGAYAFGCYQDLVPWVIPAFRPRGFHIVSLSYRLTPHAKLVDMLQDCQDAFNWCREHLPTLLQPRQIDLDRYVTAGDSAGGSLATLLPFHLSPAPRAVIDIYGITDLTDSKFSPFHLPTEAQAQAPSSLFISHSESQCIAGVRDASLADALSVCPSPSDIEARVPVELMRKAWSDPTLQVDDRHVLQVDMERYLWRSQTLLRTLLGLPQDVTENEYVREAAASSPVHLLGDSDEQYQSYPPTYFIHGFDDTAVGIDHSLSMVRKLTALGVEVGESYEPGDHCFDRKYTSHESEGWKDAIQPCVDFVFKHTRQPGTVAS